MEKFIKLNLASGATCSINVRHIVSFRLVNHNPLASEKTCIINVFGHKLHVRQTPAMIILMLNYIACGEY